MKIAAIIPVYNEEAHISDCLQSIIEQVIPPDILVIVDDGSTDNTPEILKEITEEHDWIKVYHRPEKDKHETGGGVVAAVEYGLDKIPMSDFDILMKLDGDLIFPESYVEIIRDAFLIHQELGICGGACIVYQNGEWVPEQRGKSDHIRGALKAWRRKCFDEIGGLRSGMGWDTVDEHLARFHGWKVLSLPQLQVKHLKPTDIQSAPAKVQKLQGVAYYRMGYGPLISLISASKHAESFFSSAFFRIYMAYLKAAFRFEEKYVTKKEAAFIRRYRYLGIWELLRK